MALVQQLLTTASSSCRSIMLQNRTLHNYQANCLQCSTFTTVDSFEKLSRKARICCGIRARQPRYLRFVSQQKIYHLRSYTNEPGSSSAFSILPLSKEGFTCTPVPIIFSFRPFGGIVSWSYSTNGKMHFSHDAKAIADKGSVGPKVFSDGNKTFFKNFKNHSERSKGLSVHRRNAMSDKAPEKGTPNSKVSASKNIDLVISKDNPVKVDEKDVNLDISGTSLGNNGRSTSTGNEKAKKQSRSKKNKNVASDAVDQPKVSRTPRAKKSSSAKDEESPAVLEISSPIQSFTVGSSDNVSMKVGQGKRTSPKKRKSTKESNSLGELNEATVSPSGSKLVPEKSSDVISKSKPPGPKKWPKLYPPTTKSVLVVESATKARVIQGYLGDMFEVLPSYGHVRDLAARSGSVRPDDDFSMVWEVPSAAWTHLKSIKVALSGYIAKTLYGEEDEDITSEDTKRNVEPAKLLGVHPTSNEKVLMKNGPYGYYVQLGEDKKGYIPKRASLSQVKDVSSVTLEDALELLRYPVTLGNHPDDGQPVVLKLAKFGFTIRHRRTIAPVPKNLKPRDITMEKALKLLVSKDVRRCGRPKRQPQVEEAVEAM